MQTDLRELQQEIHRTAKEKGWWEQERVIAEMVALVHSEWSEALEEWRTGRPITEMHLGENDKPEGFFVEIADGFIRLLDLAERHGIDASAALEQAREYDPDEVYVPQEENIGASIARLHRRTCTVSVGSLPSRPLRTGIGRTIGTCLRLAENHGVDLLMIVRTKMAFNKTRSYRHGGKIA